MTTTRGRVIARMVVAGLVSRGPPVVAASPRTGSPASRAVDQFVCRSSHPQGDESIGDLQRPDRGDHR